MLLYSILPSFSIDFSYVPWHTSSFSLPALFLDAEQQDGVEPISQALIGCVVRRVVILSQ